MAQDGSNHSCHGIWSMENLLEGSLEIPGGNQLAFYVLIDCLI